jgi:hypothetical protein
MMIGRGRGTDILGFSAADQMKNCQQDAGFVRQYNALQNRCVPQQVDALVQFD